MIAAIVPAAGLSTRMGRPKLVLPIAGRTVIARVVSALRQGGADPVVVVVGPDSERLAAEVERAGGIVVSARERPADMRASFELGLARLLERSRPDTVLLAPGDSPGITATLVAAVIGRARTDPNSVVVPVVTGRRGHPVALPWAVALAVRELPARAGVNALVNAGTTPVIPLASDDPGAIADLDTPEDYQRWGGPSAEELACE